MASRVFERDSKCNKCGKHCKCSSGNCSFVCDRKNAERGNGGLSITGASLVVSSGIGCSRCCTYGIRYNDWCITIRLSADEDKSAVACKSSTCVLDCGVVCVLRTVRPDDLGNRYASRTGSRVAGCTQDFLHGGNYGTGNVVYAGCAPVLSLPENTDFAFCFFELFENLFSSIALIRCGKISFMTCQKFGNIFACRKTES